MIKVNRPMSVTTAHLEVMPIAQGSGVVYQSTRREVGARGLLSKVRKVKHIEVYCAIAVIAIMILVFFSSLGGGNVVSKVENSVQTPAIAPNSTEMRLTDILSQIRGVGNVSVMMTESGIVIVASGADNYTVRASIIRTVQTVMGSDIHVEILTRK